MIQVERLTRRFRIPGGEVVAVDDVSFTVGPGEVYGLLGPNGAGKTTTLRMLLGLLRPTSGQATVAGYRADEVKRRVGLVSASAGLYPHLSVREMLLFFADLYAVPPERAAVELTRLADLLGLDELLDRRCATLSTGQRQRVNLARALIHRPPVLLLDEPTLGLDVLASHVVAEFVAHLRAEGKAVILTTHHLDEAERLCDRFGLLHRGRLVSSGTLAELRAATGCATLVEMFIQQVQPAPALRPYPAGEHVRILLGGGSRDRRQDHAANRMRAGTHQSGGGVAGAAWRRHTAGRDEPGCSDWFRGRGRTRVRSQQREGGSSRSVPRSGRVAFRR